MFEYASAHRENFGAIIQQLSFPAPFNLVTVAFVDNDVVDYRKDYIVSH
jgi:hypothetical protein